jgi:hypothetical protein
MGTKNAFHDLSAIVPVLHLVPGCGIASKWEIAIRALIKEIWEPALYHPVLLYFSSKLVSKSLWKLWFFLIKSVEYATFSKKEKKNKTRHYPDFVTYGTIIDRVWNIRWDYKGNGFSTWHDS